MQANLKNETYVKQAILQVANGIPKPSYQGDVDQSLKEPEVLAHLKAAKAAKKSVEEGPKVEVEVAWMVKY